MASEVVGNSEVSADMVTSGEEESNPRWLHNVSKQLAGLKRRGFYRLDRISLLKKQDCRNKIIFCCPTKTSPCLTKLFARKIMFLNPLTHGHIMIDSLSSDCITCIRNELG